MVDSARTKYVRALDALLKGEMSRVALQRDFDLLAEIARLAESDAPLSLASSDPALFATWRAAVTRHHLAGWTHMTPDRVAEVASLAARTASGDSDRPE